MVKIYLFFYFLKSLPKCTHSFKIHILYVLLDSTSAPQRRQGKEPIKLSAKLRQSTTITTLWPPQFVGFNKPVFLASQGFSCITLNNHLFSFLSLYSFRVHKALIFVIFLRCKFNYYCWRMKVQNSIGEDWLGSLGDVLIYYYLVSAFFSSYIYTYSFLRFWIVSLVVSVVFKNGIFPFLVGKGGTLFAWILIASWTLTIGQ